MADYDTIARAGDDLLASIADASPKPGEAVFWWLGQHTYIVKFPSATVLIDPYLQESPRRTKPPMLTPEQCAGFDLVLCTHDHIDHIDPAAIPGIAAASQAEFVSPATTRQRMADLGVPADHWHGANHRQTMELCGLKITAIKAAHETFQETADGLFPFLGYVIEGDGARVYHAGDTLWWEGLQAELQSLLPIDVAFVPINGRDAERYNRQCWGNTNFAEAADLVGPLGVGLAVPAHFDMFVGNSEDPDKFIAYMACKYPATPTWLGPAGEPVTIPARKH